MSNIVSRFISTAEHYQDKVAIHDPKQSITYHKLLMNVRAKATYFRKKGIKKGDKVLVMEGMGVPLYANVLALFYIGASAVFLDRWVTRKNIDTYISSIECAGIIGSRKVLFLSFMHTSLRKIPVKLYAYKKFQKYDERVAIVQDDATALVTFTTGSTGIPKAANRTHRILHAQCDALIQEFDPCSDDIDFTTLPVVLFLNLILGRTSIISHQNANNISQIDIQKLMEEFKTYKVSSMSTSPSLCKAIAHHSIHQNTPIPLRQIVTGGGPVYHQDAEIFSSAYPDTKLSVAYGSTEAEPISSIDSDKILKYPASHGLPVGFIHTNIAIIPVNNPMDRIDPESFNGLRLPTYAYGEIVVTGDHVVTDYISKDGYTHQDKILVGEHYWHKTGDAGYIDSDGMLFLVGRTKELIPIDDGYIAPFIIEAILSKQKGVRQGTLIHHQGNLYLCIEKLKDDNIDIQALLELCPYIHQDNIRIINSMPMDPRHHTKIDYAKLRHSLTIP